MSGYSNQIDNITFILWFLLIHVARKYPDYGATLERCDENCQESQVCITESDNF